MKPTISTNPMKSFLDKYVFGKHDFKHIRHVKLPNGTIRVFDGVNLIEVITAEKTRPQGKASWVPVF
jgi:hypothetical protein